MKYSVFVSKRVGRSCTGRIFPAVGTLQVATHDRAGLPREPAAVTETFWHEAMHAILHDMDHRLNHDEQFVTGVAKRLTQIVNTARF